MAKKSSGIFALATGVVMGAAAVFLSNKDNREKAKKEANRLKKKVKSAAKKSARKTVKKTARKVSKKK